MNKKGYLGESSLESFAMGGLLFGFILFVGLLVVGFVLAIIGLHIETSNGEHTGYITAVETNGFIYKTDSVYVKSDLSSSQEDRYCIVDKAVTEKLKQKAMNKEQVTLIFNDWMFRGWKYCKINDSAIVIGVK